MILPDSTTRAWLASSVAPLSVRPCVQLPSSEPGSAPSSLSRIAGKASLNWIGCRSTWCNPTPFRAEREAARSRLPRCWRSTKRGCRFEFARQLFVGQSPACHLGQHAGKTITVIALALVVAERLFIQIAEQMEWLDADIRSLQSALQERPEIFNRIRMYVALNVGFRVIDDFVNVLAIQTVIAKPSVSENVGAALYVLANLSLQSVALNVRHVDDSDLLVLAVYQSHHDRLTAPGPAGARDLALFILVHVAGE